MQSAERRRTLTGSSSLCESLLGEMREDLTRLSRLKLDLVDKSLTDLRELIFEEEEQVEAALRDRSLKIRKLILLQMERQGCMQEDSLDARVEVRAGVGGGEALKWASEIFTMLEAACCGMGWDFAPTQTSEGNASVPGSQSVFQAIVKRANGHGSSCPFGLLKFESGVHRVQRVPFNSDRMQTSAAAVFVIPKVDVPAVHVRESDLKISISKKSSGAGGQSVNAAYQQVRMTHIPSGFACTVNESHAQQENREIALERVRQHLERVAEERVVAQLTKSRKSQIKTADRSEKVRTYNFQRGIVTDHRLGGTAVCEEVLAGGAALVEGIWGPLRERDENDRINVFIMSEDS